MAYVSDQVLKDYFRDEKVTADDPHRFSAAAAAEEFLNTACDRNFTAYAGGGATARLFDASYSLTLRINDCTSVTSVTLGTTLISAATYRVEPFKTWSGEVRPYNQITRLYIPWYYYPDWSAVSVVATWGWAAVPASIIEATKILARDIASNRDINNGIAAITQSGATGARDNKFVRDTIAKYAMYSAPGLAIA